MLAQDRNEPELTPHPEAEPAAAELAVVRREFPTRGLLISIGLAAVLFAADYGTKVWASRALGELSGRGNIPVLPPFLEFQLAYNKGGAFSLFSDHTWLLTLFSAGAVAGLLWWMCYRLPPRLYIVFAALGLVLGGALGNLHDRLRYQHVIDFIHFYILSGGREVFSNVFNVADIGIVVGIGIILAMSMFTKKLE